MLLGEVHTGLLQNSVALGSAATEEVLRLAPGDHVSSRERPIAHAVSPDMLTGVDCALVGASGKRVRGVGTIASRCTLTGGHVLQGSSRVELSHDARSQRMPWAHYLARPGVLDTIGQAGRADLAAGFLQEARGGARLDLAAVSARIMDTVQGSRRLDRRPPFRMARTEFRWCALPTVADDRPMRIRLSIVNSTLRVVRIEAPADRLINVVGLCEDLALHEWLLTALLRIVDRSGVGSAHRQLVVHRLRPAVDHLIHLWMPAARLDAGSLAMWRSVDQRAGLNRQWRALVERIRDQMDTVALFAHPYDGTGTARA